MKKIFFFLMGLTTMMGLGSCSKDDGKSSRFNERDIVYTVAEETTSVHLTTEAEFNALLELSLIHI